MTLTWTEPAYSVNLPIHFTVQYQMTNSSQPKLLYLFHSTLCFYLMELRPLGNVLTVTINSLIPSTTYIFFVYASSSAGSSGLTTTNDITTLGMTNTSFHSISHTYTAPCTQNLCSPYAICRNINTDFNCTCKPGFLGNGTSCNGIFFFLVFQTNHIL